MFKEKWIEGEKSKFLHSQRMTKAQIIRNPILVYDYYKSNIHFDIYHLCAKRII